MPDLHFYLHQPETIFAGRVNMPGVITYPITSIAFDGVTTGAFGDIVADMTLLLGSAAGLDDYGRVRVQNVASSTEIPIPRTSQGIEDGELTIVDNAYITVWMDFRVWAKHPYIAADGEMFKDSTVPLGTFGSEQPPVANCGPGFAGDINSDTSVITVTFPPTGVTSFAVADGATIATYAWDVDDGTVTVGTSASAEITATFPAGFRYVALTVTDSNGKSHTSRCPVYARNPASDTTLQAYGIERHHIGQDGQELTLRVYEDLPRTTYPDGLLVMFWDGEPLSSGDRSNIQFIGWHQLDEAESRGTRTGTIRGTVLHCVDVGGRLRSLPGFPQSLARAASPLDWSQMVNPNMDKYLHYLLQWHSTALSLADYTSSGTGDDYVFVLFESAGESLYDQVHNHARRMVPGHLLTVNRKGQIAVTVDPMLQDINLRTAGVQTSLLESEIENIRFGLSRPPRVHWLRRHALLTTTDYVDVGGTPTLPTLHAIAPGDAPGQGLNEVTTSEGLAQGQLALNRATGHEYARLNARYGPILVDMADDSGYLDVDPADLDWVSLQLTADNAAQRGFTFTAARAQCKAIDFRYQSTRTGVVRRVQFTLELETSGTPAITVIPEGSEYVPPETAPPDLGLVEGVQLVAAIDPLTAAGHVLYRTADFQTPSGSGGPTWEIIDLGIDDDYLRSFVVDPFSPGYINQNGTGAINGWVVGRDSVWRISDVFGTTPTATEIYTFAVPLASPGTSRFQSRVIQASFGAFFPTDNPWLMVVSYYGSTAGHTGTWCIYSLDAGATWSSEVQITPYYDTDESGADPIHDTDVYLSPKTPGYAITSAYQFTATPATAVGMFTTDWGATWSEMVVDDVDAPAPWWGILHESGTLTTHKGPRLSFTAFVSGGPAGGVEVDGTWYILLAPPADAVRVEVSAHYTNSRSRSGSPQPAFSQTYSANISVGAHSIASTLSFVPGTINGADSSQDYTVTWTKASGSVWSGNRDQLLGTPPAVPTAYARFGMTVSINTGTSGTGLASNLTLHSAEITEIELADGTIYDPRAGLLLDPGHRPANSIHVPWLNNDDELIVYSSKVTRGATIDYATLKAIGDGATINDISPVDATVNYGPRRSSWGIRAYDSDATYLVMAGAANDVSADQNDDTFSVFVSDDAGATWTKIMGPDSATWFSIVNGYKVAFAGDNRNVMFVWGPRGNDGSESLIGYTSDFGATVDDRSGNIFTLVGSDTDGFLGIMGGPTGA